MNGIHQNGKNYGFEKTNPGCLGRMVNIFELNLGVPANKLITDKPHRDGSPLSRSRSDVSRMSPSGDQVEDKVVVSEYKNTSSNKKLNGTPMKMLIDHEMSKEVDSRRSPPNLVAKLMGLDSLPRRETDSANQRSHFRGHPRSQSDIPLSYWEQQNGFFHYVEPNEYKDVYEIWQHSQKSPDKGGYAETTKDRKMALVRQKFIEAKRLSMDENLRQSKQFQDALDVLNSNKDLFLQCLQEPKSNFSQHLNHLQSTPPPETKRITVLKPSKMADSKNCAANKDGKQMKKSEFYQLNGLEKRHLVSSPPSTGKNYKNTTPPTRIVVLKPSTGKPHDVRSMGSPQSESPRILNGEEFFGDVEDNEDQESREVAKAITQQMRETLARHCRDETLVSSVFSNGYVGDESSFNKSEIDYVADNHSDSEVMSPVSRHSWDYVDRLDSPFSSSFSRVSYSPESSVCREAKKRLSERWAMMASNGTCQEQRHVRRSSSTLGEMLALSEAKKTVLPGGEGISREEIKDSTSPLVGENRTDGISDNSQRNLMRSKSVPVSSSEFGSRLNVDISVSDKGKVETPMEETKARNAKSSFRGKVSSLFFSRNKKPAKDKSVQSQTKYELDSSPEEICISKPENLSSNGQSHLSLALPHPSSKSSFTNLTGNLNMKACETRLSESRPIGDNLEQPSPISVLDRLFVDEEHTGKLLPRSDQHGVELPLNTIGSNLIDKSPPIGSIARNLSWDESCLDTASSYPINESIINQGIDEEEQEWFFFVKTLLSVAVIQDEEQSNSCLARWHSPESPLDPSLRDNYIDLNEKATLHEAKRRKKRSTRKLVFDCVNAALVEIAGHGIESGQRAIPCLGTNIVKNEPSTMVDEVWARMKVLFSGEGSYVSDDCGDHDSLVVERVVRKEVVGKGWVDNLRLELDNLGKEIEGELLEELVQETISELTGRV